jgi:hypothetical protein
LEEECCGLFVMTHFGIAKTKKENKANGRFSAEWQANPRQYYCQKKNCQNPGKSQPISSKNNKTVTQRQNHQMVTNI